MGTHSFLLGGSSLVYNLWVHWCHHLVIIIWLYPKETALKICKRKKNFFSLKFSGNSQHSYWTHQSDFLCNDVSFSFNDGLEINSLNPGISRVSCQKGPYLPCVSMAGRALLAGYPRYVVETSIFTVFTTLWHLLPDKCQAFCTFLCKILCISGLNINACPWTFNIFVRDSWWEICLVCNFEEGVEKLSVGQQIL